MHFRYETGKSVHAPGFYLHLASTKRSPGSASCDLTQQR